MVNLLRFILWLTRLFFGGGGDATQTQKFEPPDYTKQGWQDLLSNAQGVAAQPYQQYAGMQVAPWNGLQQNASNFIQDRAANGAPDLNAARGAATNIASGDYLNNPFTGQGSTVGGIAQGQALNSNPWLSQDYTQKVIDQNAQNMAKAYSVGTAAQTDAAFNQAGAYGGSAYQQQQAANAAGLENQIG